MNRIAVLCCAVLLVGCARSDENAEVEVPEASTISLADVAGVWSMEALTDTGDSVLVTYELVATENTDGWSITFPGREPIPVRVVTVEGDSIVVEVGPYESALRQGMMVSTRTVMRLQDGNLNGAFVARYQTEEADSALSGRQRGTRSQ